MKLSKSLIEQFLANGGNFLFFIVIANWVGSMTFGQFGILWACVQLIHGIAMQWILLPITSVSNEVGTTNLIGSSRKKLVRITPLIIISIIAYSLVFPIEADVITIIFLYLVTISFIVVDVARHVLIRENKIDRAVILQFFKWIGAFGLFFFLTTKDSLTAFSVLTSIGGSVMMLCAWIMLSNVKLIIDSSDQTNGRLDSYTAPLLRYGYATIFQSIITTFALTNINTALFGAVQAFRSLSNFFPVVLQYIESHVSARLVDVGKSTLIKSNRSLWLIVLLILGIELVAIRYDEVIIETVFSSDYDRFSYVLPFVLGSAMFQALNRLVSVEVRLKEKTDVMDFSSILLLISACLVIIAWQLNSDDKVVLLIMVFTPVCQFLYLAFWKNKEA